MTEVSIVVGGQPYSMVQEPMPEAWIERAKSVLSNAWQTPFRMRMGDHVLTEMVRRGLAERKHPPQSAGVCIYRRPQPSAIER